MAYRGKSNSKHWLFGSLLNNEPSQCVIQFVKKYHPVDGRVVATDWAYVDPDTVGMAAPIKDSKGNTAYENDYITYPDDCFGFEVTALLKYGEWEQDGSGGEYSPRKCYGWYAQVVKTVLPEYLVDADLEFPAYRMTESILEIPAFTVIGNKFDNEI